METFKEQDVSAVACPSGLAGHVRKLRMGEFNVLSDRTAVRNGEAYAKILSACWTDTTEMGSAYRELDWENALQGDRIVALLAVRRRTHGDTLEFDVQCKDQACRRKFGWKVNLGELTVKPYPADSLRKHVAGEDFVHQLGGRRVTYRLMTGGMERQLSKVLQDEKDFMVAALTFRLLTVEGLKTPAGQPAESDKHAIKKWLLDLDMDEVNEFRHHLDAVSGGLDTTLSVQCAFRDCEAIQEVELPFGAPDFWTPKKRGSSEKPKSGKSESGANAGAAVSGASSTES